MQNLTAAPQQPGYPQQEHPQPGYPRQVYSAQTYGQPQITPPTRVEAPREGCCPLNEKTKTQGYAIGAAGLLFMSGGLNIAWAVGLGGPFVPSTTRHTFKAWFIGAIIGAVITCGLTLLVQVPKKWVLLFSSLLVTIGGLVIACTHQNGSGTIAACYLDGIANGLVFAPFMALAAELSVAYKRSIYASVDQLSFGIGILLQIFNFVLYNNEIYNEYFTKEKMQGVLSTILGFLALILGSFMTVESPQHMLAKNDETGATHGLRRIGQAVSTFLPIGYLRALNAMSLSLYVVFMLLIYIVFAGLFVGLSGWYIGFVICRLLGTVFTSFCSDSVGRKKPTLLGLLVSAGMAFAIGIFDEYVRCVIFMHLVLAFFAGVAFTPSSAEGYPLDFKQHFISCTFIAEMFGFLINQYCFISFFNPEKWNFCSHFYIVGGMYLGGFIIAFFSFPETSLLTMRGAQGQFRRFLNTRF